MNFSDYELGTKYNSCRFLLAKFDAHVYLYIRKFKKISIFYNRGNKKQKVLDYMYNNVQKLPKGTRHLRVWILKE